MSIKNLNVIEKTKTRFDGTYAEHDIEIEWDKDRDSWYIIVTSPSGSYAYDGWWSDSEDKTIDEAIEEALDGAQLRPRRTGE